MVDWNGRKLVLQNQEGSWMEILIRINNVEVKDTLSFG